MDPSVIAEVGDSGAVEAKSAVRTSPERNRAVSDTDMQSFLLSLYECPICLDFALPPILQCNHGHIVCNSCYCRITMCPICREPLSHSQPSYNLAMKQMANRIMFPCKFVKDGCNKMPNGSEKFKHKDTCDFCSCSDGGAAEATSAIGTSLERYRAVSDTDMQSFLLSLYECSICLDFALPPILQCTHGHIVCNSCYRRITFCTICWEPLSLSQPSYNLIMKQMANRIMFPCKFVKVGCNKMPYFSEKFMHEDTCDFRSCRCPMCDWNGLYKDRASHMLLVHKGDFDSYQSSEILTIVISISRKDMPILSFYQACFGHLFRHHIFCGANSRWTHFIHLTQVVDPIVDGLEQFKCIIGVKVVDSDEVMQKTLVQPMPRGLLEALKFADEIKIDNSLLEDGKLHLSVLMKQASNQGCQNPTPICV